MVHRPASRAQRNILPLTQRMPKSKAPPDATAQRNTGGSKMSVFMCVRVGRLDARGNELPHLRGEFLRKIRQLCP